MNFKSRYAPAVRDLVLSNRTGLIILGGVTALMRAVQRRHPEAAKLLRNFGADLDRKNRAGVSARDMAASENSTKTATIRRGVFIG